MMRDKCCRELPLQPASAVRPLQSLQIQRANSSKRRALTFLDLAITVMIIGLLAAISMPKVAAVQRKNYLRSAAMTLAEHLCLAREIAMSQAIPVEVIFTPSLAVYEAPLVPDPERPGSTLRVDLRKISSTMTMTAAFNGTASVVFGVDGLPRVNGQPVTSSSLAVIDNGATESVTLLLGWGSAKWQAAPSGSPGVFP